MRSRTPARLQRVTLAVPLAICALAGWCPGATAATPSLDPSFGKGGVVQTVLPGYSLSVAQSGLALQRDGRIVVAGNAQTSALVARYLPNGALDPSFDHDGLVATSYDHGFFPVAVAIQPDGKILVAGTSFDASSKLSPTVARYLTNGALDPSFGTDGIARAAATGSASAVLVQRDRKLVIASGSGGFGIIRAAPDGKTLDTSFDGDGSAGVPSDNGGCGDSSRNGVNALALAPGAIIASGSCGGRLSGEPTGGLLRFRSGPTANGGALDTSFGTGGAALSPFPRPSYGDDLVRLADGRLLQSDQIVGGSGSRIGIFRMGPTGHLDPSFGTGGRTEFKIPAFANSVATGLARTPNGALVVSAYDGQNRGAFAVARRTPNGAPDPTFGSGGQAVAFVGDTQSIFSSSGAATVKVQPDDRAVLAGTSNRGADSGFTLLRFRAPVDRISALAIAPKKIVPGRKRGGFVSYTGTEPAVTTFTVQRILPGRRKGKRCVKPTNSNRSHKHCARYRKGGSFKRTDAVGPHRFRFTGILHGDRLDPGRYRLRLAPHNSGGAGKPVSVKFRVKQP